jgi:hypothetical protein
VLNSPGRRPCHAVWNTFEPAAASVSLIVLRSIVWMPMYPPKMLSTASTTSGSHMTGASWAWS